jgi:transcriptional regulator with XRE-family HTH domain
VATHKPKPNLFGVLVRKRREELKMTLSKMAQKTKTHKGYICGIEWGKVNPPAASMTLRYAKALGYDAVDLIELSEAVKAPKQIQARVYGRMRDNPLLQIAIGHAEPEMLPAPFQPQEVPEVKIPLPGGAATTAPLAGAAVS